MVYCLGSKLLKGGLYQGLYGGVLEGLLQGMLGVEAIAYMVTRFVV